MSDDMLFLQDAPSLLQTLYPEENIRVFEAESVSLKCTCSRKRGRDAILILGQKEAEEELATKNSLSVTCDFCNKEYIFDRVDVAEIFENHNKPPSSTQLH
jgi:molecular chaperone Hsp33